MFDTDYHRLKSKHKNGELGNLGGFLIERRPTKGSSSVERRFTRREPNGVQPTLNSPLMTLVNFAAAPYHTEFNENVTLKST